MYLFLYLSFIYDLMSHPQLDVLPDIAEEVKNRIEIYLDGGIRSGSDVFKALALGARAVFLGRPVIWGLIYGVSKSFDLSLNIQLLLITGAVF